MPRTSDWSPEHCVRSDLPLSEQVPVGGSYGRYPKCCDLGSDMHYGFELGVVRRGRVLRRYKGVDLRVGPGEAWLCGLWEPHTGRVTRAPCELAVWTIWPPMLAGLRFEEAPGVRWTAPFTAPPARRPQIVAGDRPSMVALAGRFAVALRQPENLDRQIRLRLLLMEALLLLRHGRQAVEAGPSALPDEYARINRAVQLVFETRRAIGTEEAARACDTSRSHFDRLFARQMGISFARFELRHRLHGAARVLLGGEEPLKAIAAAWGFTDASHFLRRFREYYGCSPKEYRQKIGGRSQE
jgi:AraC-like DNA-binding protein